MHHACSRAALQLDSKTVAACLVCHFLLCLRSTCSWHKSMCSCVCMSADMGPTIHCGRLEASAASRLSAGVFLQQPTVLKINRKDTPSGTSTFVLWPGSGDRYSDQVSDATLSTKVSINTVEDTSVDASSHDSTSSTTMSLEAASKFKGANRVNSRQSIQNDGSTDEEASASNTVYVAVFEQGSGKVWGCASSTLHDVMDDCLQSGHVLVVLPSCQYQPAYSTIEADCAAESAHALVLRCSTYNG